MGKVTALCLDTITEKSGHVMTGFAVSVCLTPAAPVPLPIPYPTFGTVLEGIIDPCMRTKIEGAKILTVGGCMKACHGNEPGTLKEIVSLNTTGPCFPWLGAPIVFIELGMAGITGSLGQMNKSITVGAGASASGTGGTGSGGGSASLGAGGPSGGGPGGGSNAGGGGGGSSSGAAAPSPPAAPGTEGQATAGHPVDVVTGALFTDPVIDLWLTGFLSLRLGRSYSSAAAARTCGIGFGWSHDLDWSATRAGERVEIVGPGARAFTISPPVEGEILQLPKGIRVTRSGADLVIDRGDGYYLHLRAAEGSARYTLDEVRDAFGNAIELAWQQGELVGLLDSVGRRAILRREGAYRIWDVAVEDEAGQTHLKRAVTYELDEAGDLVRILDAGGAEVRYAYDAEHYLVREELPDGLVYHFRHEAQDGVKRCVETWGELIAGDVLAALGTAPQGTRGIFHTRLAYEPARRITVVTDGLGQAHTYAGNDLGLVDRYVDPRGYARQYHYDSTGNLLSVSDGGGRISRRSFDAAGRPTGYVGTDGAAWRCSLDDAESSLAIVRPDGRRDGYRHRRGALTEHVDPSGGVTTFARDERGRLREVVRPDGGKIALEHDAHGNARRVTQPSGAAYEYTFDLFGCPVAIKSARGVDYRLHYDSRDDLVLLEELGGKRTELAIDPSRRVTARREAAGTTTFTYVAGALVETVRPDDRRYRMGYDALLRLRTVENPAGERYERDYDGSGNIVRETSFAGVTTRSEFDGSSHLVRVDRGEGSWTRFERDGEGRVVKAEHAGGLVERFRYDALGQLVSATSGASSFTIERDEMGRAVREIQETGGFRFEVTRTFDAGGAITSRTYSTGWSVTMKRRPGDGALLSLRAVAAEPETLAFDYDARGEEIGRRRIEGTGALRWERDGYGLPTKITILGEEGRVIRERSYAWSPLGPVAAIDDSRFGPRRYELDPEGRPLAVEGLGTSERFTFAPQGTPVPAEDRSWSLGRDGRPVAARGERIEWDARGRLARRSNAATGASWEYRYDDRDRLLAAVRGDGFQVRYLYDAIGRCVGVDQGNGQSTWFGWDGDTIVEEQRSSGERTQRVFADDGFTPLLEARDGKDWRLIVTDGAGTPWLHVHGDLGLSELELTTWGSVARKSGDPGAMRFAGQRADEATGLHYNRHRFYAPDLHVYLTPDPLGINASLQDVGFLRNATIYIDPLGLTIIINADPNDQVINDSTVRLQAAYPGATVLRYDQLTPGSLAGDRHVIVNSHGAPGGISWGNGWANGQQVGDALNNAGFRGGFGSRVDITACNSATPQQGGGPGTAQSVANATGAKTYGAMSSNPAGTYANTTTPGPGGVPWGPGMLGTTGTQTPYLHDGTYVGQNPNTAGGWGRRVWRGTFGR